MRVLLRRMERGRDKGDERRGQTDTEAGVLAIRTQPGDTTIELVVRARERRRANDAGANSQPKRWANKQRYLLKNASRLVQPQVVEQPLVVLAPLRLRVQLRALLRLRV